MARLLAHVGARLRAAREKRNLTQEQMGQLSDVPRTYINAVENGRKNIRLETLARFATALGVEMTDLLPTRAELKKRIGPGDAPSRQR